MKGMEVWNQAHDDFEQILYQSETQKDRCDVKKDVYLYYEFLLVGAWFMDVHMGTFFKTRLHIVSQMFSFGSAPILPLPLNTTNVTKSNLVAVILYIFSFFFSFC